MKEVIITALILLSAIIWCIWACTKIHDKHTKGDTRVTLWNYLLQRFGPFIEKVDIHELDPVSDEIAYEFITTLNCGKRFPKVFRLSSDFPHLERVYTHYLYDVFAGANFSTSGIVQIREDTLRSHGFQAKCILVQFDNKNVLHTVFYDKESQILMVYRKAVSDEEVESGKMFAAA